MSRLLVVGSVARDHLEGRFGTADEEPGGSAIYFALAASLLAPVTVHGPVGRDDAIAFRDVLADRPHAVDVTLLDALDAPTYRWSAEQHRGTNRDRGSRDSIYDLWRPRPPDGFDGWAFVGSMRPDRQAEAARALPDARLFGDSMRSYVKHLPDAAAEVIDRCDWFFANEEELRALGGDPADADGFRRRAHLTGLVVKAGPKGSSCYTDEGRVDTAAIPVEVVDVTGAGDALAGGMLARWLTTGAEPAGLPDALKHGAACAAIAISDIGVRALKRATPATLAGLVAAASASS